MRHTFLLLIFTLRVFCETSFIRQFREVGFIEIVDQKHPEKRFDSLYENFDALVEFFQANPVWEKKLYLAKERFIRSKDQKYYSTDFFGFYDESKGRGQVAFYYSSHFHSYICSHYPEFNQVAEITRFLQSCREIQKPYGALFSDIAKELELETIFSSGYGEPAVLFKVIKYLPSYVATRPHYDGTAFSLFLDSTDNGSLLLSAYKPLLTVNDFSSPQRDFPRSRSILLIPGDNLTEFSISPTPHIVAQSGKVRYAAIAFAMRPNYVSQKAAHTVLPNFRN